MKFLVRDDDTCAFTDPDELIKCYEHIWDRVPINLSVTPFRIPGNSKTVPKPFRGQMAPIPLEKNKELVCFLKEKQRMGNIYIAMHGYNHTKPHGLPEYVGGTDLLEKTRKGKDYLERILNCSINTFVPPNNGIARNGFKAIVRNGLNLINIPPLLRSRFRTIGSENIIKYLEVKYYFSIKKMRYPYVLRFSDHKEVEYHSVTPSQQIGTLLEGFRKCRKANGIFIFSLHYHAFNRRLKSGELISDVLDIFLEMADKVPSVEYLTYDALWNTR